VVAGGLLGAGVAAGLACAVMIASKLPLWLAVPLGTLVYAATFLGVGRTRAAAAAVTLLGR
jgi:hypothetical protein